jgi:hypothetical protein
MHIWSAVFLWITDITALSLVLAIFEILIEHQYGWGGRLNPSGWGRKLFAETIVSEVCEKSYLTVYHVFTFAVVLPSLLFVQLLAAVHTGMLHPAYGSLFGAFHGGLLMEIGDVPFLPFLFLASIWFAILVVEDALWFALNWYYPRSWQDLLQGKIWWHTRWVSLGNIKLPRFYVTTPVVAVVLLALSLSVR